MAKASKTSSGGVAEASGSNYEVLVAAWHCVRILLGATAQPDFDIPASTTIKALRLQSTASVDDVNLATSDEGRIYIQAKRSIALTASAKSPLGSAIDQFVQQFKTGSQQAAGAAISRPLEPGRDRLVLATRGRAPKITHVLPRLLRRIRDQGSMNTLADVAVTDEEKGVADGIEAHVRAAWTTHFGAAPSDDELGRFFRLLWVQTLDVEDGEGDRRAALDLMRANLLSDRTQAELAFSALVARCGRLRAERSGADASGLMASLSAAGIGLLALPDYRADVEALRRWTQTQIRAVPRFTRLLVSQAASMIERAAWPAFEAGAHSGSIVLVGEPGAGKSGFTYRLADEAARRGGDVVLLPVDLLSVTSLSALRAELGIQHELADVLRHWPGAGAGLLVVDALDAARTLQAQTILRTVIDDVQMHAGRWNVIASVRTYDLRYGPDWREMFRGPPVSPDHRTPEFNAVRHLAVQRLSDEELEQTTAFLPALHSLFVSANDQLRALLRNIFNLHLLADLVDQGAVADDLAAIRTQSELLDTYWRLRVRRNDGQHGGREAALRAITEKMIEARSLKVFRADFDGRVESGALVDLEQHDLLRAEEGERSPNEDVLLFTHHVLFDYAVARLLFRRGLDANAIIAHLKADRTLAVLAAPSLTMAVADLWSSATDRQAFWELAIGMADGTELPATAHLAAPMVAAEFAESLSDLDPLLAALRPGGPRQRSAERVLANLIGAINVRRTAGAPSVGPGAGPWMDLARALAELGTEGVVGCLRVLLAVGTQDGAVLTADQQVSAGAAARGLLEYGLSCQ